jgi:hypothetical protein
MIDAVNENPTIEEQTAHYRRPTLTPAELEDAISEVIKDVCELPDYTSPDDNPDLLQCTVKELDLILRRHLLGAE